MLQSYYGVLALLMMASGVSALFLYLSAVLGPKKPNAAKDMPYECGMAPFESPSGRHAVRFYLAGMLFVLFDIELIFFFPWAVVYRQLGVLGFAEMMLFMVMLVLGFAYAWRKGALQWK